VTFWNSTLAYNDAEAAAFAAMPVPRTLASTQVAQAGWRGVFDRKLPRRIPTATAAADGWYEWLIERCHLIIDGCLYDGKVMHIALKPKPAFYVLISFRGAAGPAPRPDVRGHVSSTASQSRVTGCGRLMAHPAQPGVDPMPCKPQGIRAATFADGREAYVPDAWTRPLSELLVAVGPAPHIYLQVKARDGAKAWVEDDGGCVLVKDADRPKLFQGYQGDESGRYSRIWLNKDRVKAVTKASVGWTGGDVWRRRNAAVLAPRPLGVIQESGELVQGRTAVQLRLQRCRRPAELQQLPVSSGRSYLR
jgi:hypothetical protein